MFLCCSLVFWLFSIEQKLAFIVKVNELNNAKRSRVGNIFVIMHVLGHHGYIAYTIQHL